ncbi:sporulation membrane protein YtrI [Virgibacillus sp. YIM 98842]|uniref:sporulation membrane protein YtrI n=1 Tax=Virgibacillus sp. YIM 98842 TaxID=2663533 RepID=UPI0013DD7D42|nr:sporulation membrane protein YtrI [Virgibacillus sp. YIM 98842]
MHIPPFYKKPTWQRFFAGTLIGGILAYGVFLYMYGSMFEEMLAQNRAFQAEINDLENQNEALIQDMEELSDNSEKILRVETIEVTIANSEQLGLDRLLIHDLEEMVKQEVDHIIGQDLSVIGQSDMLLESTIKNKDYIIDDFHYKLEVKLLTIWETVRITVEATMTN